MSDKIEKSTKIENDAPKHAMKTAVRLFGQLNNQKGRLIVVISSSLPLFPRR